MSDGLVLLNFIDDQKQLTKKAIAAGLKISRRTLYQYFDSHDLQPETKQKLEEYFGTKIFTQDAFKKIKREEIVKYPFPTQGEIAATVIALRAEVSVLIEYLLKMKASLNDEDFEDVLSEFGQDVALQMRKLGL